MKINEKTLLPLSMICAIAYVAFLVGGTFSRLNAAESRIVGIEESFKTLKSIESRLVSIETKLEMLQMK